MAEDFVVFLDILGTSDMVMKNQFSDFHALDFANPVGIAASFNPKMRFSVFSDSVIISASEDSVLEFIYVISFLYSHWFADGIFVRGGISKGGINWVYDHSADEIFLKNKNLSYSRVYGKALINAHFTGEKSGPGAICFVDELASNIINLKDSKFIVEGHTDMLIWADKNKVDGILRLTDSILKNKKSENSLKRQIKATNFYFKNLLENKSYLPDQYLKEFF